MILAGVDEVGRGPLAGPVVSAAVILGPSHGIEGLTDSKKLTPKRRETLAEEIKQKAVCWALGRAEVAEIDTINILQASLLSMTRAVEALLQTPDKVLVDGNKLPKQEVLKEIPGLAFVEEKKVSKLSFSELSKNSGVESLNI